MIEMPLTFDQEQWKHLTVTEESDPTAHRILGSVLSDVIARSDDPPTGARLYTGGSWRLYTGGSCDIIHTWGSLADRMDWLGLVAFVHACGTGRQYDIQIGAVTRADNGFDIEARLYAATPSPQAVYSALPINDDGLLDEGPYGDVFTIELRRTFGGGWSHLVLIY